jgi:prepilin-type N-terminal cleavage/methylation domain-containing protein
MKKSKRSFTLLEMMIALMIITLIGAITAVQVKKMTDAHGFEAEITPLFITLQEAQVFSAAYETDLALDIGMEKGKLFYRFSTDEPLPSNKFKQESVTLGHTTTIKFKDAKTTKLHFDIYSGGRIEPGGVLAFYPSQEGDKALWFDLQRGLLLKFAHHKPPLVRQQIPSAPKQV